MKSDRPYNSAWLGYRNMSRNGVPAFGIAICAYHDPKERAESERRAKEEGFIVTHGICPECAARMTARFVPESEPVSTQIA